MAPCISLFRRFFVAISPLFIKVGKIYRPFLLLPLIFKRLCAFTLLVFISFAAVAQEPDTGSDVRLLIDISGSMKQNDPSNLRRPAVDLLVRLLPEYSRVGIWSFGANVNLLAPHQVIDDAWKKQALNAAQRISSQAKFTNIGAALEKAADAQMMSGYNSRHIILLTDGMVDISTNSAENTAERERILRDVLPRLASAGYKIHTIALSPNADVSLLKTLSQNTDGLNAVAVTADELMSAFLKIFAQAVKQDQVPLKDNKFTIDASIKEFTALIFRAEANAKTMLVSPSGIVFSAENLPENAKWYRSATYDLVTVKDPAIGEWNVDVAMGNGSRVTVVSNFKLVVNPLATHIYPNAEVPLYFHFEEDGKPLTNGEFLKVITTEIRTFVGELEQTSTQLLGEAATGEGAYSTTVSSVADDEFTVKIAVDGKTFAREFTHVFKVSPTFFTLISREDVIEGNKQITYTIIPSIDSVRSGSVSAKAFWSIDNKMIKDAEFTSVAEGEWEASFVVKELGQYSGYVVVKGEDEQGNVLSERITLPSFWVKLPEKEAPILQPSADNTATSIQQSWMLYSVIGAANFLVLLFAYYIYRYIKSDKLGKSASEDVPPVIPVPSDSSASLAVEELEASEIPALTEVYDLSETAEVPLDDEDDAYSPQAIQNIAGQLSDVDFDPNLFDDTMFPLDDLSDSSSIDSPKT